MTHIPNFNALTVGEKFIVGWQYNMLGDFNTALIEIIQRADIINLFRLNKGFPDEVAAYQCFREIGNWWPEVQRKAGLILDEEEDTNNGRKKMSEFKFNIGDIVQHKTAPKYEKCGLFIVGKIIFTSVCEDKEISENLYRVRGYNTNYIDYHESELQKVEENKTLGSKG